MNQQPSFVSSLSRYYAIALLVLMSLAMNFIELNSFYFYINNVRQNEIKFI